MIRSTQSPGTTVKPVTNAFQILRHLNSTQKPERAVDIARHLSINPSTCFNILRTLVDEQILEFNSKGKTYSVGLGLLKLVKSTMTDRQKMQAARLIMARLAAEFRVTITVWKKVASRLVLLGTEASPAGISISMYEGQRVPALMGASGRVLAGFNAIDIEERENEFNEIRWASPLSFAEYKAQVEHAKENGWAIDRGYFSNGITTVAVPITNDEYAIFSLSAVTITGTFNDEQLNSLRLGLTEASKEIAACLF